MWYVCVSDILMLRIHGCDLLYMRVQINIVCDMYMSMCYVLCMYVGCWCCVHMDGVLICICVICCRRCVCAPEYVSTYVYVLIHV